MHVFLFLQKMVNQKNLINNFIEWIKREQPEKQFELSAHSIHIDCADCILDTLFASGNTDGIDVWTHSTVCVLKKARQFTTSYVRDYVSFLLDFMDNRKVDMTSLYVAPLRLHFS